MALKPVAIQYTCRNPGQTSLLWTWQPAPVGHGWVDVKAEPLVRLSDVDALCAALRQIRDNSDDLTACEIAADALKDSEK